MDDQPPNTVKDLLVELKDASELMVDLAYAAVFFNEEKIAEEVIRLDSTLRRTCSAACGRWRCSPRGAPRTPRGWPGVLWIADAIQRICAAASDIARVVAARLGIPDALRPDLRHADEMTARCGSATTGQMVGQTLRELSLPTETGMWVMAIRSENRVGVRSRPPTTRSIRATCCWSAARRRE